MHTVECADSRLQHNVYQVYYTHNYGNCMKDCTITIEFIGLDLLAVPTKALLLPFRLNVTGPDVSYCSCRQHVGGNVS